MGQKQYNPVRPPSENVDNRPVRTFDFSQLNFQDAPDPASPAEMRAANGASGDFNPEPRPSGYSTNVPMPSNNGPALTSGDGKDGMGG